MEATETETLQAILDAEKEASRIYDEALKQRNEKDAHIAYGKDQLHLKYAEKVKSAIAAAEKSEAAGADAEIARLNAETNKRLSALRAGFECARAGDIDTIFGLVIGETDE